MQKINQGIDENHPEVQERVERQNEKQINFERRVENVAAIFMYTMMDELENFVANGNDYNSCIKAALNAEEVKTEMMSTLYGVLTTPTIASAADNYILNFADSFAVCQILNGSLEDYLKKVTCLLVD